MSDKPASTIRFGTDGWRAIIGEGFTAENAVKVADAAAQVFKAAAVDAGATPEDPGIIYIGHDCRQDAHEYAALVAQTVAEHGFDVILTADYCPTPALCWSVAHDPAAVGGIMLTSSHNPAEYLGIKLRMADGGASPADFTDVVEGVIAETEANGFKDPAVSELARLQIPDISNALEEGKPLSELATEVPAETKAVQVRDLMPPYLDALRQLVDADAIKAAGLRVVIDPLFGAGRHHLAELLREMGVQVDELHNVADPTFAGLHPEPIQPWVDEGLARVAELGYDALFINDGDADRISAGDSEGNFVNPHRIITLVTENLAARGGADKRVVSTVTASQQLANACQALGLEYVTTPVGFKWIYGEMERGGVLVGGEESGGIGLPGHVKERDGLLMALLLTEMMAKEGKPLGELVKAANEKYGSFQFSRRGLTLDPEQEAYADELLLGNDLPSEVLGIHVSGTDTRDGVKLMLDGGPWVMMRKSGTEPLVRIYAEAPSADQVEELLDWAEGYILGK
ncbi:MAG: phosphoglucosamine mutase [Eggerthellaceae bacterium]|nr:phosphoglucosamine mutase [Eggerthellaceae bacterium]